MAKLKKYPSKKKAEDYVKIVDKALALPRRGVHVGQGRHVAMSDTIPGEGWTITWAKPREKTDNKHQVHVIDPATVDLTRLTIDEAVELENAWETAEIDPPEEDTPRAVR